MDLWKKSLVVTLKLWRFEKKRANLEDTNLRTRSMKSNDIIIEFLFFKISYSLPFVPVLLPLSKAYAFSRW